MSHLTALGRSIRVSPSRPTLLGLQPSSPSSPTSRPTSAANPVMVPLEEWHLRFFFTGEELETLLNSWFYGQTLLSVEGAPLGFGGVYTQPNEKGEPVAIAFFYGGPNQIFMRKYIKLALRALGEVFADLARMGVTHIY